VPDERDLSGDGADLRGWRVCRLHYIGAVRDTPGSGTDALFDQRRLRRLPHQRDVSGDGTGLRGQWHLRGLHHVHPVHCPRCDSSGVLDDRCVRAVYGQLDLRGRDARVRHEHKQVRPVLKERDLPD
jgi:hypothetical protein